jgi:hypothetical protein
MISPQEYRNAAKLLSTAQNAGMDFAERFDAAVNLLGVLLEATEVNWKDPDYLSDLDYGDVDCG